MAGFIMLLLSSIHDKNTNVVIAKFEVAIIGKIHHANVVQLISNGSLDSHIFSQPGCDIQILHFDIKPHNILLDTNFTPKLSDFGLAKFYPKRDSIAYLTATRETVGCMAPELFYKNIIMADKRKNLNAPAEGALTETLSQIYYPFWVYDRLSDGKLEIEDATDEENEIVRKMITTGLRCIQMQPSDWPSMNKAMEMLEGDLKSLQLPPTPLLYLADSIQKDEERTIIFNIKGFCRIKEPN